MTHGVTFSRAKGVAFSVDADNDYRLHKNAASFKGMRRLDCSMCDYWL